MLNKKIISGIALICICLSLCACTKKEITVFAAASLEPVLTQIFADYEKEADVKIVPNYAASGQLVIQLEGGAKANIFISAGAKQAKRVVELGMVEESYDLVQNTLVMVWKNGSYDTIHDALNAKIIAMGETETVPAGQYAKEALENAEIYTKASQKAVYLANVREVLTAVKSGNADVGFVYKSDLFGNEDLKHIQVPQELYANINYPLVLLNTQENKSEAQKLIDYLFRLQSKEIFEAKGFTVAERE